jgi:histidyl-tRNA synthetase
MRAWREVARRYAFVEYDGPPLEPLDLYTKKSGEEIVGQLYNFVDKGDRQVALRPEMTPTFARMVAARANALRKPVRWFSIPQLFRYERQQKGRLKEHFQLNVDIVGEATEVADAELLSVAIDVMRELGLTEKDVRARVSDRRLLLAMLSAIGVSESAHGPVFLTLDKKGREPHTVANNRLVETGLSPEQCAAVFGWQRAGYSVDDLRREFAKSVAVIEHAGRLARYFEHLDALGVRAWVDLDLSIVRGLDYYTGIVFELFDAQGEHRAICGGGRYDRLIEASGGPKLEAVGFGMGDVVLGEIVKARGLMDRAVPATPDLYVIGGPGSTTDGYAGALRLVAALRSAGFAVDYGLSEKKYQTPPRGQFEAAQKAGALAAVYYDVGDKITAKSLAGKHNEAPSHGEDAKALLGGGAATERLRAFIAGLRPPPRP